MNKRIVFGLLFAALLVITPACGSRDEGPALATEGLEPDESAMEQSPPAADQKEPENPSASGPCGNVLFPLADGNSWTYAVETVDEKGNPTTDTYTWSVSEQTEDSVTLDTLFDKSGTVVSAVVSCKDGSVEKFPMTVSSLALGDVEGAIEYTHVSGRYLPSEAELEAGNWENSWQTVVNSSGTISAGAEGQTMEIMLADSPITMNWQIIEKDASVEVPAGAFSDAVRVSQELIYEINSMKINAGGTPMEISTKMTFNTDYWFVPDIGLVKTEINSAAIELFDSAFPVEITGGSVLTGSNLLN